MGHEGRETTPNSDEDEREEMGEKGEAMWTTAKMGRMRRRTRGDREVFLVVGPS